MSGAKEFLGTLYQDVRGDIGSAYQDILLQDSPLKVDRKEPQIGAPDGKAAPTADKVAPAPEMVGLDGEVLPEEQDLTQDEWFESAGEIEGHSVIDAEYEEVPPDGPFPEIGFA